LYKSRGFEWLRAKNVHANRHAIVARSVLVFRACRDRKKETM